MRLRHSLSSALLRLIGPVVFAGVPFVAQAEQSSAVPGGGKALTVERIYSQPSLSGRLTRGLTPFERQRFHELETVRPAKTPVPAQRRSHRRIAP